MKKTKKREKAHSEKKSDQRRPAIWTQPTSVLRELQKTDPLTLMKVLPGAPQGVQPRRIKVSDLMSNNTSVEDIKLFLFGIVDYESELIDTDRFITLAQDREFRARFGGYLFSFLQQTEMNVRPKYAAAILEEDFSFDREKEICDQEWIIPLTGMLEHDLRANHVAHTLRRTDPDEFRQYVKKIYGCIERIAVERIVKRDVTFGIFPFYFGYIQNPLLKAVSPLFVEAFTTKPDKVKKQGFHAVCSKYKILENTCGYTDTVPLTYNAYNGVPLTAPGMQSIDAGIKCGPNSPMIRFDLEDAEGLLENMSVKDAPLKHGDALSPVYKVESRVLLTERMTWLYNHACQIEAEREALEQYRLQIIQQRKSTERNRRLLDKQAEEIELRKATFIREGAQQSETKMDAMEKQIRKLEAEIAHLQRRNDDLCSTLDISNADRERLATENRMLTQENTALWNTRDEQAGTDGADETLDLPDESELDISVLDGLQVLCYGGHPSWIREMKRLPPNVVFYGSEVEMPLEPIRKADMVWVQPNAISHPKYYKVRDEVKAAGKKLMYFNYASHAKCKAQLCAAAKQLKKVKENA